MSLTTLWLQMVGIGLMLMVPTFARSECDCLWQGSFAEVQQQADLVISATVIEKKGNSIDLAIAQVLRGDAPATDVRVWLKAKDYCRPEPELFPIDSEWVMALQRIDKAVPGGFNPSTPNISYGRLGDYQLSSCGGYWLHQSGAWVTGNLVNAPRWAREPKMTPVLLELVTAFINGETGADTLLEASRLDPAMRELMLDTKEFLRTEE